MIQHWRNMTFPRGHRLAALQRRALIFFPWWWNTCTSILGSMTKKNMFQKSRLWGFLPVKYWSSKALLRMVFHIQKGDLTWNAKDLSINWYFLLFQLHHSEFDDHQWKLVVSTNIPSKLTVVVWASGSSSCSSITILGKKPRGCLLSFFVHGKNTFKCYPPPPKLNSLPLKS